MSVLVDTSVWVDHFRQDNAVLTDLLTRDLVLTHPFVIAELACGTPPKPRARTLANIALLQTCHQATLSETMRFIEEKKCYGLGCGFVDMTLLASTLVTPGARIWTLDTRLADIANRLGVMYRPALH